MQKFAQSIAKLLGYLDPRKLRRLSRKQALLLAAAVAAVYVSIVGVNTLVLKAYISGNNQPVDGIRRTLDTLTLGADLGSQILDEDLKSQKAIGRVGGYYLSEDRFLQIAKSEKQYRKHIGKPITDEPTALFFADLIADRMVTEQLVGAYVNEHGIEADRRIVELRIAQNLRRQGSLKKLKADLLKTYGWSLPDFRYAIEFAMLQAKMEEQLGGVAYTQALKQGFQQTETPRVRDYADKYARTHINYLISGGRETLAKRILELPLE